MLPLPKFIPINRELPLTPDTRVFLVDWLKVCSQYPRPELISYLPSLGGLFTFLGDSHKDAVNVTHTLMDSLPTKSTAFQKLQTEIKMKRLKD
ncbi:ANM_HP_G0211590.mRNA.1.CDS.1 [Saccharomyces cerevisiae]|nr:ANM_HP_G0211590.mRNA.1.CDS.1 [Saccharomyces cerevisiae]CAI6971426.1 ANM_HP_G0211590.mRNA.1.CDS.1 [Saccharomyces cerevisiae]